MVIVRCGLCGRFLKGEWFDDYGKKHPPEWYEHAPMYETKDKLGRIVILTVCWRH